MVLLSWSFAFATVIAIKPFEKKENKCLSKQGSNKGKVLRQNLLGIFHTREHHVTQESGGVWFFYCVNAKTPNCGQPSYKWERRTKEKHPVNGHVNSGHHNAHFSEPHSSATGRQQNEDVDFKLLKLDHWSQMPKMQFTFFFFLCVCVCVCVCVCRSYLTSSGLTAWLNIVFDVPLHFTLEPSDEKRALRCFPSKMISLRLSKKLFVLKKKMQKTASKNLPFPRCYFFVCSHTLRLTAGRAFGCPFLENQLAGLRALFTSDDSLIILIHSFRKQQDAPPPPPQQH